MKPYFTIGGLLHTLAVVGLLLAPLARPAMAMPMSIPPAMGADMDGGATAMGMPDDMPCCPDQAPASDCGKVCPLMAMCSAGTAQYLPTVTAIAVVFRLASIVVPVNDAQADSLARGPPRRPPKN